MPVDGLLSCFICVIVHVNWKSHFCKLMAFFCAFQSCHIYVTNIQRSCISSLKPKKKWGTLLVFHHAVSLFDFLKSFSFFCFTHCWLLWSCSSRYFVSGSLLLLFCLLYFASRRQNWSVSSNVSLCSPAVQCTTISTLSSSLLFCAVWFWFPCSPALPHCLL